MSVGRRAFLQFVGGAVGGTLLSPLPWKLADDSAIWSQNWSWRPSPERGEITEKPSVCQLCPSACGILVDLVNGKRAVRIRGNAGHPFSKGGICPLGASGLQFLYAPYRIPQPLKQTGSRGDPNGFKPISWDEALKEMGTRLAALRQENKAPSVAVITGQSRGSMVDLWRQFMTAYGSPNLFTMPDESDSQKLAAQLAFGTTAPFTFAFERADYVLSFGLNLLDGWGPFARMQQVYSNWRTDSAGAVQTELVQIEGRASVTASKASQWVAVRPGTEALFALGLAYVLIESNLYDAGFMADQVFGFDDWTDAAGNSRQGFKNFVLKHYSPDQVSKETGASAEEIIAIGRKFGAQKSALAVWGQARGAHASILYHDLAFMALNLLKGNHKSNGLVGLEPSVPFAPLPETEVAGAGDGLATTRLDLASGAKPPLPGNALHSFCDALAGSPAYPIELLLVHEANPAYALAEPNLFRKAVAKTRMVVSFASTMDETAAMADLILPNHSPLERLDDLIGLPATPGAFYAVAAPVIAPQHDTRSSGDVLLTLARAAGEGTAKALPWNDYETFLKGRVKGLAASQRGAVAGPAPVNLGAIRAGQSLQPNFKSDSDLWKKLLAGACWYDAPGEAMATLPTASGRIELACSSLPLAPGQAADDQLFLPHYQPLSPSGAADQFPLQLVTYQTVSVADGLHPNPPFMNKLIPDDLLLGSEMFVEIHPRTAQLLQLADRARVVVQTPQAEAGARVRITHAARPGCVFMARGFGHKNQDEYVRGKGVNANELVEVQLDPLTGLGTVWITRAQLRKA